MCVNRMHRLILPIPMSVPDGDALADPVAAPVAFPVAASVPVAMSVPVAFQTLLMPVLHS